MDQDPIKAKAELIATQYMVANIYASMFGERFGENALPAFRQFAEALKAHVDTWTVPGLDAALSDHLSAEMQESIQFQLALIDELVQQKIAAYKAGARPGGPPPQSPSQS
ncbi:MAG: hypothetical protein A3I01_04425 [Betaproteobacteria bacterium RIFCSPLOWO2_02_FULL_65_24]|nr:MAG: hypothetical protein A3I01_04425 [Betaproteobacteria bacterium RIFCSPLOWO2_02_FULL_65_24]OGA77662.1 MAG: hypothetical protein A3G27_15310 [Betaproteobacteria bacterium RIFCSPLOWO2_12_FULL_66_14]